MWLLVKKYKRLADWILVLDKDRHAKLLYLKREREKTWASTFEERPYSPFIHPFVVLFRETVTRISHDREAVVDSCLYSKTLFRGVTPLAEHAGLLV